MLNKIVVMGRLTRDPELRRTQSGLSVTSFSVACDRDFKNQSGEKETDFIEYIKQKEILFIKNDMKKLDKGKTDYTKLLKYFKRKLVDYGAIREIKNSYKSEGKYIKVKEVV